jgi:hypothetical protein
MPSITTDRAFVGRAQMPLHMTYRAVGSGTGMAEFVGNVANGFDSYTHFGSGDIPITGLLYDELAASSSSTKTMLHIPIALGYVAGPS